MRTEAAALEALACRLEVSMAADFDRAVELIMRCGESQRPRSRHGNGQERHHRPEDRRHAEFDGVPGIVSTSGRGGARRPGRADARRRGDCAIASGETEEILRLLATLKRKGDALISFCCNLQSTLAQASDVVLDCGVEREACGMNLAPTATTTAMLALGDALAVAVSVRKGFKPEDFAELHPGGKLGKRLAKVRDLMHAGDDIAAVAADTPMTDVIYEMSSKKLGMTTVQEGGRLGGVISDGDLRRLLEHEGGAALTDRRRGDESRSEDYRSERAGCASSCGA